MDMDATRKLLLLARRPHDLDTLVIAGVLGQALEAGRAPLIRGLAEARFQRLINEYFVDLALENHASECDRGDDEFEDLLQLLLDHRSHPNETSAWLAYAVASAAMGENHLWQDMGLPSRRHLSNFMISRFGSLAARNTGDMKWKKFFYRQMCERAGVPICKSPHCADCCDYAVCFGPEDDGGPA